MNRPCDGATIDKMTDETQFKDLYLISTEHNQKFFDLAELYQETPNIKSRIYNDYLEAEVDIEVNQSGVVIFHLETMDDLKDCLSFIEGIKKYVGKSLIKVLISHKVEHPKLKKLLRKVGCAEIIKSSASLNFFKATLVKYIGIPLSKKVTSSSFMQNLQKSFDDEIEIVKEPILKEEILSKNRFSRALDFSTPMNALSLDDQKIRCYYLEICHAHQTPQMRSGFVDVKNHQEKISYFNEASTYNQEVTIWTRNRSEIINTTLFQISEEKYQIILTRSKSTQKVKELIREQNCDILFIKMDTNRGCLFFELRSPQLSPIEDSLVINIPQRMWKIDRRKYHRLNLKSHPPQFAQLRLKSRQESFANKRLLNISAGGACLNILKEEEAFFQKDDLIDDFSLFFNDEAIRCHASVKRLIPSEKDGQLQMGIEFNNLSKKETQSINLFILEETFNFWERFHPTTFSS